MRISLRHSADRAEQHPETVGQRQGFSLIEVIVSMVLLAIAVSSLGGLMISISQSSMKVTGSAYRNGILMHEVNRLIALPYDSLGVGSLSFYETGGKYPHTRVVTISEPSVAMKKVVVVLTPANPIYKPDTLKFTRTNARTSRVLCTICP